MQILQEEFQLFIGERFVVSVVSHAVTLRVAERSREHTAAREHSVHGPRHLYASVFLDASESIKILAAYLGHSAPSLTPEVCAHLMPSSRDRARKGHAQASPWATRYSSYCFQARSHVSIAAGMGPRSSR